MTPNCPLRTRVEIIPDRSVASAGRPLGDVHAVDATGVTPTPRARERRIVRRGGRFFVCVRVRLEACTAIGAGDAPSHSPAGARTAMATAAQIATRRRSAGRIRWCIALEVATWYQAGTRRRR